MRRSQCVVTDVDEIINVLQRCTIGRLGTIGADGYPYITPLNYVFWKNSIYFHCARDGEKIDNILRDSKVCFEVDIPLAYLGLDFEDTKTACQAHQFYHSVIIRGKAEIVQNIDEKVGSLNALMAAHENIPEFSEITSDTPAVATCSVVVIRIETVSAKSDLAQKKDPNARQRIADYLEQRDQPGDAEAAERIVK